APGIRYGLLVLARTVREATQRGEQPNQGLVPEAACVHANTSMRARPRPRRDGSRNSVCQRAPRAHTVQRMAADARALRTAAQEPQVRAQAFDRHRQRHVRAFVLKRFAGRQVRETLLARWPLTRELVGVRAGVVLELVLHLRDHVVETGLV